MIWGLSTETFTLVHVIISFVGIAAGFVVMWGWLKAKRFDAWTGVFLAATVATSVTGFGFPFTQLGPAHKIGILSLALLALAIVTRYAKRLAGPSRWLFVVSAAAAEYLNVFVLVVQAFQKVPALKSLAPTQKEPPFAIAQLVVLGAFVAITCISVRRFRPAGASCAPRGDE